MEFQFLVTASAERSEGKFASREEIMEQARDAIEGADPGSYEGENGGTYDSTSWEVEEHTPDTAELNLLREIVRCAHNYRLDENKRNQKSLDVRLAKWRDKYVSAPEATPPSAPEEVI